MKNRSFAPGVAAFSDFLRRMYASKDPGDLALEIARHLPAVIDADQVIFNYIRIAERDGWFVAWPRLDRPAEQSALFLRHMHEHPKIRHFMATGDPSAGAISDFVPLGRFRQTSLYQELYRPLGYRDHLGVLLGGPARIVIGVGLGRGGGQFSSRDRAVLDCLRPHFIQAWRNARCLARLTRLCARRAAGTNVETNGSIPDMHRRMIDAGLTPRECQIMTLVGQGRSNREIAALLFISTATVRKHLEHIYAKLDIGSRTAALARLREFDV